MRSIGSVRFWQPAPEAGTELVGAYLEASDSPPHVHEEWQFGVLETPSTLSLGAFRRHVAQTDDVTIVHPYDVHSEKGAVGAEPKWRMLYVAPSLLSRLYGEKSPRFQLPVVSDPAGASELRELLRGSDDGSIDGSEFLERVELWLRQFLLRHADEAGASALMPAVDRARTYLLNRPTEAVTLTEVGAVAAVTTSHLVRSFSRVVGLPPRSYHAQVRLARARRLLAEGNSATWVAYECGFADQSHLNRRFKECHGITPGVFQGQYRAPRSSGEVAEPTAA